MDLTQAHTEIAALKAEIAVLKAEIAVLAEIAADLQDGTQNYQVDDRSRPDPLQSDIF